MRQMPGYLIIALAGMLCISAGLFTFFTADAQAEPHPALPVALALLEQMPLDQVIVELAVMGYALPPEAVAGIPAMLEQSPPEEVLAALLASLPPPVVVEPPVIVEPPPVVVEPPPVVVELPPVVVEPPPVVVELPPVEAPADLPAAEELPLAETPPYDDPHHEEAPPVETQPYDAYDEEAPLAEIQPYTEPTEEVPPVEPPADLPAAEPPEAEAAPVIADAPQAAGIQAAGVMSASVSDIQANAQSAPPAPQAESIVPPVEALPPAFDAAHVPLPEVVVPPVEVVAPPAPEVVMPPVEVVVPPAPEAAAPALAGRISGTVARAARPEALGDIALTLTQPDGTTLNLIAGEQGAFSLPELPPGAYALEAAAGGTLSRMAAFTLEAGQELALPPVTLLAGDVNGDNIIDLTDAVLIAANFNLPALVPEADLNGDGWIDIHDLVMLGSAFGLEGPLPWR